MIKIYPYFKITFADVGQGECIFIRSGNVTYLVDAGSSDNRNVYEYVIRPCLLSNGCDSLDYLIITHCDSDHISAVTELYDDGIIEVKNILMPDTSMIDEEYEKIINIAEKNGTKIIKASKGMEICSGNLYIKCIHPPAGYSTSEKNNYSTVLYLKYKTFSALLTGDIPDDVEKSVVQSAIEMEISGGITILKAAHHGSRNSNSEDLISYFNPEIAVISCGKDNSYGHPHKEATERFNRFGCKILRTDLDGAISVYVINSIIRINT